MAASDDPSLPDDEHLNRRVLHQLENFLVFDENLGRYTPGNAAVRFDPDLSVYLGSVLAAIGLEVESILTDPTVASVFAVQAGEARSEDFGVEPSPVVPPQAPIDQAHGSVWKDPAWGNSEFRQRRNRLRKQFLHVAGELPAAP